MFRRTRHRLALMVAAGALAVGVAQAPASADSSAAAAIIDGASDSGCSTAYGDYSYSLRPGSTDQYSAGWSLWVEDTCSGLVGHIRVRYSEWTGTSWVDSGWQTIASSASDAQSHDANHLFNVKDVRFAICDYSSSKGNHNCGYVS
ncbi:hypothetical protein [Streptomyces flaveolus]|uniref:hypothetical protein n=1 Tax=Streptomyces flaveolus TaxID=67297 RepID=UPI00331D753C